MITQRWDSERNRKNLEVTTACERGVREEKELPGRDIMRPIAVGFRLRGNLIFASAAVAY